MTAVAVVGAGGYVGGRLVQHLREQGVDVIPISRQLRSWLGDGNVAVDLLADPPSALEAAIAGAGTVIHVAGHDEVVAAREPERALTETIAMTSRVADAVRRAGTRRVVYLSTVHVYGAQLHPGAVVTEETVPQPRAPYAIARLASEHLLEGSLDGVAEVVSLRLTNSVGAPAAVEVDRWSLLVNDLCRQAVRTGRLVLQTAGLQQRDWVSLARRVRSHRATRARVGRCRRAPTTSDQGRPPRCERWPISWRPAGRSPPASGPRWRRRPPPAQRRRRTGSMSGGSGPSASGSTPRSRPPWPKWCSSARRIEPLSSRRRDPSHQTATAYGGGVTEEAAR